MVALGRGWSREAHRGQTRELGFSPSPEVIERSLAKARADSEIIGLGQRLLRAYYPRPEVIERSLAKAKWMELGDAPWADPRTWISPGTRTEHPTLHMFLNIYLYINT